MSRSATQEAYESRLRRFLVMMHGQEGLIAKLAIFRELVKQHRQRGDGLWQISAPLYFFARAMQTEVLLELARILESKDRSWGNLEKFLNFAATNGSKIKWETGTFSENVAFRHKSNLAAHAAVISSIQGRRDKVLAHLDRKYFFEPESVDDDYPITDDAIIALANAIIDILSEHERGISNTISFHLAEFYHIAIDNMVRDLESVACARKEASL